MTIKELKEKFPQDKHGWKSLMVFGGEGCRDYNDNDIVISVDFYEEDATAIRVIWRPKPKPTLSKDKLDKVIECNRAYFKAHTGTYERDNAIEELNDAEEDCGEIKETGLLDIISPITLSTKAHDTPNETIYKVFEALGYEIK